MKIPLAVDLDIQAFSGASVTDYNSGITNGLVEVAGEGYKITQRPSIDISEDSTSIAGLNDRARGIFYWENNAKLYIVHDNDVYESSQDSTPVGTISAGSERVTILETLGTPYMIILDAENDEGWYMNAATTVTQIASNFPSTLCHGGAVLDGYLFVMDEDGVIYNSNVNDPTTFGALDFLTAERDVDKGVYLGKHHDHIVAFGTRTIEFFYNASNPSESPLSRRRDIFHNIGCVSGLSVWENGDIIFFIGSDPAGQLAVYKLQDFQVQKVSRDALNSYLTIVALQEDYKIVGSGFSAMGHTTYLITLYTLTGSPGSIVPSITFAYDDVIKQWSFWKTAANSHTTFPLIAWSKRTGGHNATVSARSGEGIFYNGDILSLADNLIPIDSILGGKILEDGIVEAGILASFTGSGTNINFIARSGLQDFGTNNWKFQGRLKPTMKPTSTSQTLTIKHSDESSNSFGTGRDLDTSLRQFLHRGGRFVKRNYQIEYSGDEQFYIEDLDIEVKAGIS